MDDNKSIIYGIYGASGLGKEVLPLIRDELRSFNKYKDNIIFVDDKIESSKEFNLNECKVINFKDFLSIKANKYYMIIAIADTNIRKKLTQKCLSNNINMYNVMAENVVKMDNVKLGDGYILSTFVTITSDVKIGKGFQANMYSYVAHDCQIGDFVTLAPSVKCNGNVKIGDGTYIGTGVIIHQGNPNKPIQIGKNVTIGAGAIISKNIPDNTLILTKEQKIMYISK
jgi:sugar O-acyltransferase (sialic acid O-acetyltransferase NeuD family)